MLESLHYAIAGILHAIRTQRNMRIHALFALLVLMGGIVVGLDPIELSLLVLTIVVVMATELVNTAVEAAVDLATEAYHPLARIAKNVAAGAVLLTAIGAVIIGVLLFFPKLSALTDQGWERIDTIPEVLTLSALGTVLVVVVIVKGGGSPFRLQGGFPSAHTAVAFAMATLIWALGSGGMVTLLAVAIAALVGQARLEAKIHTVFEVVVGALIGVLVTLGVFQLLR